MNVYLKKQNFRWQKIAIGIGGVILFIGILNIFQGPIKNTFYIATSPFFKLFWTAGSGTSGLGSSFLNAAALSQENSNLKQENQNLLSKVASLQDSLAQDRAIAQAVQNTQNDNFNLALVEIIGVDALNDMVLINKGLSSGIEDNMPVISSTKVLYGKVYKAYKNFSQVMLISNSTSVVDVKIQQTDAEALSVLGVAKGLGNSSLYLDLVSSEAQISEFDMIITSGQEGVFPKDLLVGKIHGSDKNDLKPFQTASILPFFDINNIENLFVITDYLK